MSGGGGGGRQDKGICDRSDVLCGMILHCFQRSSKKYRKQIKEYEGEVRNLRSVLSRTQDQVKKLTQDKRLDHKFLLIPCKSRTVL